MDERRIERRTTSSYTSLWEDAKEVSDKILVKCETDTEHLFQTNHTTRPHARLYLN
jgi:hypothetical protein